MIVVRTGSSPYFDEAYFVLRREIKPKKGERHDILSEANRILAESETVRPPKKHPFLRAFLTFAVGVLIGAAAVALILLVF